jgi:hypothetical protein
MFPVVSWEYRKHGEIGRRRQSEKKNRSAATRVAFIVPPRSGGLAHPVWEHGY